MIRIPSHMRRGSQDRDAGWPGTNVTYKIAASGGDKVFGKKARYSERRKYQRFTYWPEFRPILECQKRSYRVINISAGGLRLEVFGSPNQPFSAGAVLSGWIYFANKRQLFIEGDLVWIIGNEMGIKLREPIDQDIINTEVTHYVEQI